MAITNPEAVAFSNTRIRPAADRLAQLYYWAKLVVQEWNATGMATLIPNQTTETMVDGAATDGRHVITGAKATSIITRLQEFITDYEQTSNAKLNTVLAVSVHNDP